MKVAKKCVMSECKYYKEYGECSSVCSQYLIKPVLTNYDRIRNMTIDEMAEFMRTMLDCVSCQSKMMNNNNPLGKEKCNDTDYFKMCNGDYRKCLSVCKKWLLQKINSQ